MNVLPPESSVNNVHYVDVAAAGCVAAGNFVVVMARGLSFGDEVAGDGCPRRACVTVFAVL